MSTHTAYIFMVNKNIFLNICFLELSEEFPRESKLVRTSGGKRFIGVRIIVVLL